MSDRHRDDRNRQSTTYGRRRFLATTGIAVSAGIAGCSGGGGGSGDEPDGSSGGIETGGSDGSDSAGSGRTNCSAIWSDYLRFEPEERPFAYSCDYPKVFGEQSAATPGFDETQGGLFIARVEPDSQSWDYLQLNLQQSRNGTTETQANFGETWESLTQTEFNGETITAYLYTMDARSVTTCGAYLPYEVDGRTLYFEAKFILRAESPNDEELSNGCVSAMEEAATDMIESVTQNPDATDLQAGPFVPTTTVESN